MSNKADAFHIASIFYSTVISHDEDNVNGLSSSCNKQSLIDKDGYYQYLITSTAAAAAGRSVVAVTVHCNRRGYRSRGVIPTNGKNMAKTTIEKIVFFLDDMERFCRKTNISI